MENYHENLLRQNLDEKYRLQGQAFGPHEDSIDYTGQLLSARQILEIVEDWYTEAGCDNIPETPLLNCHMMVIGKEVWVSMGTTERYTVTVLGETVTVNADDFAPTIFQDTSGKFWLQLVYEEQLAELTANGLLGKIYRQV